MHRRQREQSVFRFGASGHVPVSSTAEWTWNQDGNSQGSG